LNVSLLRAVLVVPIQLAGVRGWFFALTLQAALLHWVPPIAIR
jgi:hypothetical protein